MSFLNSIDFSGVNASYGSMFNIIPEGVNKVKITKVDAIESRDKATLKLSIVTNNQESGFIIFNLKNPSEIAQRIAREQYVALCREVGVQAGSNIERLIGKVFFVKTTHEKYNEKTYARNVVMRKEDATEALKNNANKPKPEPEPEDDSDLFDF